MDMFAMLVLTALKLILGIGACRWFPFSELTSLEMPFTAGYVIKHYLNVGCKTEMLYGGIADGERVVFTEMPEGT